MPPEQYDDGEVFGCPCCRERRAHMGHDVIVCDVRVCGDCMTTDLERLLLMVDANYRTVIDDRHALMKFYQRATRRLDRSASIFDAAIKVESDVETANLLLEANWKARERVLPLRTGA